MKKNQNSFLAKTKKLIYINKNLILGLAFSLSLGLTSNAVEIDDFTIKSIVIKEESHIAENYPKVKALFDLVEEKVIDHEKSFKNTNYKKARQELEEARKYLNNFNSAYKSGNTERAIPLLNIILKDLRDAQLALMPSRVVETRGLYLDADSIPTDKNAIALLIRDIKNAHFNIIYPEVFRRGYSIFPNTVADVDDRFRNLKFDVLKTIIDEAHKQDIEVYPWIWTFRIKSPLYDDAFLKKYDKYAAKRSIYRFEDRETLFLSPAEPAARALISKMLRELTIKYKIDGMLLDYIRYDETLGDDILSKKYFREYFFKKYKKDPPPVIEQGNEYFNEWQIWRENNVTTMVKNLKHDLTSLRPDMKIGVAIFRTEKEGRLLKMQDWRHWGNNNYIDFVCPMLYTDNNRDLNDWLNSETDRNTRFDYLYPSLGAHRFNTADDFYPEVGLLYKRNIPGLNIFSLIHLGRENLADLAKGVFRKEAQITDKNIIKSVKSILFDTSIWLKGITYSEKNIPVKNLKNLIYKIDVLNSDLNQENENYDYNKLKTGLDNLKDINLDLSKDKSFPKELISEISEPLNYALRIIEIDNHIRLNEGKYIPPTNPPKR